MIEAQKSVVRNQILLSVLSLVVFFIPYGDEISLSSLFYIGSPYGLIMVLLLFAYLIYNVRLNWLNGATYESSYFLNLIFVPLFFLLYILLDFIQYSDAIIEFYIIQFIISAAITITVITVTLYLALRVDQRYSLRRISKENNISVSLMPLIALAIITFVVFLIEGLIYLIRPDTSFFYNAYTLINVFFHLIVGGLFLTLYFLADSSVIINIKDKLHLGVGLSIVTLIYSLYFYGYNFSVLFDDFLNYSNLIGFGEIFSAFYLIIVTFGLGFGRFIISRQTYLKQKNFYSVPVSDNSSVTEIKDEIDIVPDVEINPYSAPIEFEAPMNTENRDPKIDVTQTNENLSIGKSKFTGGLFELVAVGIVQWLIIIFTLGIGTPFAIVFRLKWMNSHTYIEGRQLDFTGNALDLIFQWIKWILLSFITLGIYGFWVGLRMHQWIAKNTVFKQSPSNNN